MFRIPSIRICQKEDNFKIEMVNQSETPAMLTIFYFAVLTKHIGKLTSANGVTYMSKDIL